MKICKKHGLIMDDNTGCPECFHQKEINNQEKIEKIIKNRSKKGIKVIKRNIIK